MENASFYLGGYDSEPESWHPIMNFSPHNTDTMNPFEHTMIESISRRGIQRVPPNSSTNLNELMMLPMLSQAMSVPSSPELIPRSSSLHRTIKCLDLRSLEISDSHLKSKERRSSSESLATYFPASESWLFLDQTESQSHSHSHSHMPVTTIQLGSSFVELPSVSNAPSFDLSVSNIASERDEEFDAAVVHSSRKRPCYDDRHFVRND
mmetsp:Transcript_17839/g.31009  ORF Transcript_17839/g.31009 Transcript_17839/m.31009 type:complete len:208 (+) Transcript_17839:55-678(+)